VDWTDPINKPVRPSLLGAKAFMSFPIEQVLDYIDWNPFFQVRGITIRGGVRAKSRCCKAGTAVGAAAEQGQPRCCDAACAAAMVAGRQSVYCMLSCSN
jgi:5-methyltetrahydrofolate--homocysteine methyltransferase